MSEDDSHSIPYIVSLRGGGDHVIWASYCDVESGFFQLFDDVESMVFTVAQHSLLFCAPYTPELANEFGLEPIRRRNDT